MIGLVTLLHEKFVKQLDGSRFAGLNCTMASGAMLTFRHTLGRLRTSGSKLRALSGDTSGGTNLDQLLVALHRLGVFGLDGPYRGLPMRTFYAKLRTRGAVVQGSAQATYGTKWRASFTFRGNHAWYVARGRDYDAQGRPAAVLVFDPLGDGRYKGIVKSPFWLPRAYFEKFCALLDFGYERLGYGSIYALLSVSTVPHRHATAGGVLFRRKAAVKPGYRVRSRPGGATVGATKAGDTFDIWQKLSNGPLMGTSRVWYGDHSGTRWIHSSGLR